MSLAPTYHGPMDPAYPCRIMSTRHCPALYEHVKHGRPTGGCGDGKPCARYESEDETPWLVEVEAA